MNDHPSAPDGHDELTARIARALRSRDAGAPDPHVVAAQLEERLADLPSSPVTALTRRGAKVVAAGVVTSALAVAGAGAAAAANPYSGVARTVEGVAHAVGLDWSVMPDGYTRAQYDAFWATYDDDDMAALSALWQTGDVETKARAGQLLLDGQTPPLALARATTASPPDEQAALDALWDAGYSMDDVDALSRLWHTDGLETKARAGAMLLAGTPLPVAPSGTGG